MVRALSSLRGSGFILTADGLGGTNYHVLKRAAEAFAECCNGRKFYIASVEGADLDKDLMVFQMLELGTQRKPEGLPHVTLGSWKDVSVGDKVIAVGSPEGLSNSVSDGILSAVRESDSVHYLQITAPISPGSSGGPVLNAAGQMVGVATFQLQEGQNLNFAGAADHILPLLDQHLQASVSDFHSVVSKAQHGQPTADVDQAVPPPGPANRLRGQFAGTVYNKSASLSAEFAVIVRDDDGSLSGCMLVAQPLFGSGPLAGAINDSDVWFSVSSAIGTISFSGKRTGESISGEYIVSRNDGRAEEGTFALNKFKGKALPRNFDPASCPTDAEVNR